MPRNGSGTYTRPHDWTDDAAASIGITASRFDTSMDDIANEITNSVAANGVTTMSGNLQMGNNRVTGAADGTARTDLASVGQLQDGNNVYATATGSSNAYAITLSPAITAYAAGQLVTFKANHASTGAATLNVNSVGAKTIKKNGSEDISAGDIADGQIITVIYDGTNFQIPGNLGLSVTQTAYIARYYN